MDENSYTYTNKQHNTTNLNNSLSIENEKRAPQVGLKPTTHSYRGSSMVGSNRNYTMANDLT